MIGALSGHVLFLRWAESDRTFSIFIILWTVAGIKPLSTGTGIGINYRLGYR